MSTENNTLLNFLKQQSLFNKDSPTRLSKRSSSRSRGKQQDYHTPVKQQPEPPISFDNLNRVKVAAQNPDNLSPNDPSKANGPNQNNLRFANQFNDSRFNAFEEQSSKSEYSNKGNDVFVGLVSYSTSFQSSRVEAAQSLQNLSRGVTGEIININMKIENFNIRMHRVISDEFKNLKTKINQIIQECFKESERSIKEYMKVQEQKFAGDMVKIREQLQKQSIKIEAMREEIKTSNWRKTAGEIIASELESKVQQLIRQSSEMNMQKWEFGDLVSHRLKELEKNLRETIKLKREN